MIGSPGNTKLTNAALDYVGTHIVCFFPKLRA